MNATQRIAHYEITVYLDRPIEADEADEAYTSQRERVLLERAVVKTLGKLDGDWDCEVMSVDIVAAEDAR